MREVRKFLKQDKAFLKLEIENFQREKGAKVPIQDPEEMKAELSNQPLLNLASLVYFQKAFFMTSLCVNPKDIHVTPKFILGYEISNLSFNSFG